MSAKSAKAWIRRHFDRQAASYDGHARVQRWAAEQLLQRARPLPRRILEIGCGTGRLTEAICRANPEADVTALDFAPAMLAAARRRVGDGARFVLADAETYEPDGCFDLIISNATFQWFQDVPSTLARLARALHPGGRLCLSTFGPSTFAELHAAFAAAEQRLGQAPTPRGLPLADAERWQAWLAQAHLMGCVDRLLWQETFPSALAFLHDLKRTGATFTPAPVASPRLLREALRAYDERFMGRGGVPVSYEVLFVDARR